MTVKHRNGVKAINNIYIYKVDENNQAHHQAFEIGAVQHRSVTEIARHNSSYV